MKFTSEARGHGFTFLVMVLANLTFPGTFSSNGEVITPMIIYQYVRLPENIVSNVPDEFYMRRSDSGWMKSETFYEFIAYAFDPRRIQSGIKKTVILFECL